MNIRNELRMRLITEANKYSYGCVMLYYPITKTWWDGMTKNIKKDDLFTPKGQDNFGLLSHSDAHITLLYGIHNDVPDDDVETIIDKIKQSEITLSKLSIFDNKDSGFDVIKFEVKGKELYTINKLLVDLPHTTDYPEYSPHLTVAYVKAGKGIEYVRTLAKDEQLTIKPSKIVYSKSNGTNKEYNF